VDLVLAQANRPLLLWFDDLQWADDVSLEIIGELARAGRSLPLLLVGAYRTDELAPSSILRPWRARLLAQRSAEEARLAPLTYEQTAVMTTLILATGLPAPRAVVDAVFERSDGVPLHVEELLGALDEAQRVDSRAIREASVPETLGDAINARVRRLSPEAQTVARSGAVIGRCFVPDVLAGIMDVPTERLEAPLQELLDNGVLDPPGLRGLYDFRHQVLRDTLYLTLTESDLRRLHARAAEFGMELEGQADAHASLHYERAGLRGHAFRTALSGARTAAAMSSHHEAHDLYQRATRNLPPDLDTLQKARLFEAACVEAAAIDEVEVSAAAARQARDLFLEIGDRANAAATLGHLVSLARREVDPMAQRLAVLEAGLAEARSLGPSVETDGVRDRLGVELGRAQIEAGDVAGAAVTLADLRQRAASLDDPSLNVEVASIAAMADAMAGDLPDALDRMEHAAQTARALGLEDAGVTAFRDAALTAAAAMDYQRASRLKDEGLRYADAVEQSYCAHVLTSTGSLLAWADGRWDEAVALGAQALTERGSRRGVALSRTPLGLVAMGRGDVAEARRQFEAAAAFWEAAGVPEQVLAAGWGLAETALLDGDPGTAISRSDAALEVATRLGSPMPVTPFAVTGARARLAAGLPAEAARWVERVRAVLAPHDWVAGPALDHAGGLVALAEGSTGLARASLERAVAGWDQRGRSWEGCWARLDLAACLLRMGRAEEAGDLAADVRRVAQRLGSRPLVERADAVARQAKSRSVEDEPWRPLTARELEVARLIAAGSTNAEIAGALGIAPKTASAHVEHILAKLGVARRAEIAAWVASIPAVAGSLGFPGR
jgi:DNA-binding CsgD family transcriptional regulator